MLSLARELGLLKRIAIQSPPLATEAELNLVHPARYIAWVQEQERASGRFFDRSTPAYRGVYERARASVGASVLAARLIGSGATLSAFNPSGGLHHAHAERASGFCIFNDVVIAVRVLQREYGLQRIAVVDLDGHHGDGTQALLYAEPLLYISLHRHGQRFYPGTGAVEEQGSDAGIGYTINVPLPRQCGNEAFLLALHEVVEPAVRAYSPECIIFQYGVDGHFADSMVRLGLTTHAYAHSAQLLRYLAECLCGGRLLVVGGGGYRPEDAIRCWAMLLGELSGTQPEALAHLHDQPPFPAANPDAAGQVRETIKQLQRTALMRLAHGAVRSPHYCDAPRS